MLILGLETSCDETGVALYDTERGLLADALFSQVDIHVEYGGVVKSKNKTFGEMVIALIISLVAIFIILLFVYATWNPQMNLFDFSEYYIWSMLTHNWIDYDI